MRGIGALVLFLSLFVAASVTAASAVEILYFKAADCPHCARFEAQELPEYQASPLAKRVRICPIDVGSFRARDSAVRQMLPPDLAWLKNAPSSDLSYVLGGTPRFLIVDRQQVLYNGFGRRTFKSTVVPYVESLR